MAQTAASAWLAIGQALGIVLHRWSRLFAIVMRSLATGAAMFRRRVLVVIARCRKIGFGIILIRLLAGTGTRHHEQQSEHGEENERDFYHEISLHSLDLQMLFMLWRYKPKRRTYHPATPFLRCYSRSPETLSYGRTEFSLDI